MYDNRQYDDFDSPDSPESMDVVRLFVRWKVLMELKRIRGQHVPLDVVDTVLSPFRLDSSRKLS